MPLLPSSKRGLGAKIEGQSSMRSPNFATMRLPSAGDMEHYSLEHWIPRDIDGDPIILDQGATSSCVAHAFIGGIHLMESAAGLNYVPASRLYAYYFARREEGMGPVLFDQGTYLRTCAEGLSKFGVPDENHWPFSQFSLTVNKRPPFSAMSEAHPRQGGSYVRIYEQEEMRIHSIKAALISGHPVAFGTRLGVSFLESQGPLNIKIPSASEKVAGNHAMLVVGWKKVDDTDWFRVLNSWGRGWRDGGLCWMSEDYMAWEHTEDLHVIHGWKRLQDAHPKRRES